MTTIAAWIRKGVGTIAADSRCSGDYTDYDSPKLFRIGKSVYAISGDEWVDIFLEWIRGGQGKMPERLMELERSDVDFEVLELAPDGLYVWCETFTRSKLRDKEFAIGTGDLVALYAMRGLKLTPYQAVKAAIMVDKHTGGQIDFMYVVQKKSKVVAEKVKVRA